MSLLISGVLDLNSAPSGESVVILHITEHDWIRSSIKNKIDNLSWSIIQ